MSGSNLGLPSAFFFCCFLDDCMKLKQYLYTDTRKSKSFSAVIKTGQNAYDKN